VLGVNVQELCIEDATILGGITANHCGDASVFLTDAVKTIIGDGYSFLLVGIALAFIGIGAYKGVTYRMILPSIVQESGIKRTDACSGTK